MEETTQHIHYLLLQEDYYTSRNVRRIIADLRPDYQFSGSQVTSYSPLGDDNLSEVDLVIADLQLSEGVFFNLMPPELCRKPVIFFAENDSFISEMKKYNLIDYVLKPVSRKDMENSLNKFEEYYQIKSK